MTFKNIHILKETRAGEARVALTPKEVPALIELGYHVLLDKDAGRLAGFSNEMYEASGARVLTSPELFSDSILLRVKCPNQERAEWEAENFKSNTVMMGFLEPLEHHGEHLKPWLKAGLTTFTLDHLHFPIDDPRNVLAAMSRLAGRLAMEDALNRCGGKVEKGVLILGTGTAAIAAMERALKEGLSVTVIGRREKHRKYFEGMGAEYYAFPESADLNLQQQTVARFLKDTSIVITAARAPGKASPVLLTETSLVLLPDDAVVIDLGGEGGNVESSLPDQEVTFERGIKVINVSAYPKKTPGEASAAFAKGALMILQLFLENDMSVEAPLLRDCYVTHAGKLNPNLAF